MKEFFLLIANLEFYEGNSISYSTKIQHINSTAHSHHLKIFICGQKNNISQAPLLPYEHKIPAYRQ